MLITPPSHLPSIIAAFNFTLLNNKGLKLNESNKLLAMCYQHG